MSRFPCAGIVVLNGSWTIVVRTDRGHYSFPKGKRQADESELTAAWRELEEETGLTRADVDLLDDVTLEELSDKGNPSIRYFVGHLKPTSVGRVLRCDPDELATVEWLDITTVLTLPTLKEARKRILEQAVAGSHAH
jgi:8-oxo-dGTP pyrophosphatase MutT (NUDIX family)